MKKIISMLLTAILILSAVSFTAFAEEDIAPFTVSGAIGDYMVLQRDTENKIWGWSDKKGEKITVSFKGNTVEGTVDENGEWLVKLPKMEADKNENDLTVTMGSYTETFTGILVGDVYMVGGQSNAEKELSACGGIYSKDEIQALLDEVPNMIRYFDQGKSDVVNRKGVMDAPQKDVIKGKKWKKETKSTANAFSAMGFFFAHKVAKEADVPVGMIMVASSGSPVSQLMSKEASEKAQYFRYENNIPVSGMYNALMHPFINTSIKAMLYYQGESEMGLAKSDYGKYNEYVKVYVEDLREKMEQNFPFYYVQLSSHTDEQWDGIQDQRAVQFDGLKVIENSGMVVSMDHGFRPSRGDTDFAHPHYKRPVGERLAALALTKLYGIGDENYVLSPEPIYGYKTDKGVVVKFKNVGDGLKRIGQHETLSGFKVFVGSSKRNAEAEIISKDEVLVKAERIIDQVTGVTYGSEILAFADYPEGNGDLKYVANLGNSNDLPAPTFRMLELYASLEEATATPTPVPEAPEITEAPEGTQAPTQAPEGNNESSPALWIGVGVVGVAVVIAAVAIIVAVKKKKSDK